MPKGDGLDGLRDMFRIGPTGYKVKVVVDGNAYVKKVKTETGAYRVKARLQKEYPRAHITIQPDYA